MTRLYREYQSLFQIVPQAVAQLDSATKQEETKVPQPVAQFENQAVAVNNHGGLGRWAFLEIDNPWNAKSMIRDFVKH